MKKLISALLLLSVPLLAACPPGDLTGDCHVDLADLAVFAAGWLTEGTPTPFLSGMTWVSINDPGISGHGGFIGEMSKYETTNAQYCQYLNTARASNQITVYNGVVYAVGDTGHSQPYFTTYIANIYSQITYSGSTFSVRIRDGWGMDKHPVVWVSWYGATAFCDYYGYRLPSEWEWQAVADYTGGYLYGCGTSIDSSKANYGENNPLALANYPYTSPVGYYSAPGYEMCDMAGNAWEWTNTVDGSYRVIRGGCWAFNTTYCTVAYHGLDLPSSMNFYNGFRVCR
jgi:formylglycine-generating enzyme required for sulfatase activity